VKIVFARDYQDYKEWLSQSYCYVGDLDALMDIDPSEVDEVLFVGEYDKHPLHLSNEIFDFQIEVAKSKVMKGSRDNDA
jgi:hypothetical protein